MTELKENKANETGIEDIKAAAEKKKCAVQKAGYYVTEFLAGPMCGRCLPCALGSYEARVRLENISEGRGRDSDIAALRRIATEMLEGSRCKKGKDTAKFILDWMNTGVCEEHVRGRCPDRECPALIEYRIDPQRCTMCGLCKDACHYGAVIGEKRKPYLSGYRPFEIRQRKCTKCDACMQVCPAGAVVIVDVKKEEPVGV